MDIKDMPADIVEAARVLNMKLHNATELGQRTQWIAEALFAERQRDQWQDIVTAPKDGTTILLWTVWGGDEISPSHFSECQIGYWDNGNRIPEEHEFHLAAGWKCQYIGEPTHWQPLPSPPKGGA